MTTDKFKSIVNSIVGSKVHLSSFGQSDLNAIARKFSSGDVDIPGAITALERLYHDDRDVDRHDFSEIEKRLKRS